MTYQGYLREASVLDAFSLAPRLRPADLAEIEARTGDAPETALVRSVRASGDPLAVCDRSGTVVALCGVGHISNTVGSPWLLGSPGIESIQTTFLRCCRGIVKVMQCRYSVLFNFVDARNKLHIQWLQWCGFKFIARHEHFGKQGLPFYEFVRIS